MYFFLLIYNVLNNQQQRPKNKFPLTFLGLVLAMTQTSFGTLMQLAWRTSLNIDVSVSNLQYNIDIVVVTVDNVVLQF